jgi:hypothetical protein
MSGVKFGNARKAWSFFPEKGKAKSEPVPQATTSSRKIKMSKKSCATLIAIIDIAGQRLLKRTVDSGEAPTDPITMFANEMMSLMRDYMRLGKKFLVVAEHKEDHISVDCKYPGEDGETRMASSVLLDLNDATSMISTGLCCLSRVYGRQAIASFVGDGNVDMFPSQTDLVLIACETDDPYDIFADFSSVLLFDDQNMDEKNQDWLFEAYTDDELAPASTTTALTGPIAYRKDRD